MRKFVILLFAGLLVLFGSCNKNGNKTWTVKYKLLNLGQGIPVYRVNYLLQNGGSKSVGPISTYNWESEKLLEFESGEQVSLEIEIISGKGQFEFQILRDNAIHEKETMPINAPSFILESRI